MRLFRRHRKTPESEAPKPRYHEGARMYCIGDVHGRADLLIELHEMIRRDGKGFEGKKQVLYLGDYIDRGPQSKQVVDLLLDYPLEGFHPIFLKGNHEQAMLDFLEYPEATAGWLSFGGRETLLSYGVNLTYMPLMKEMRDIAAQLEAQLPEDHRDFLEDCILSWRAGDYYFVHAGIRPGVALEDQHFEDQLWIRDEFVESEADHGAVVVHGHTITADPVLRANRIGLDTGAFHTGVLSCVVLEGESQRILQTSG